MGQQAKMGTAVGGPATLVPTSAMALIDSNIPLDPGIFQSHDVVNGELDPSGSKVDDSKTVMGTPLTLNLDGQGLTYR